MKNLTALTPILNQLAVDGILGDPSGLPAAAYIRVSSEEQAKEGRDGLPRLIPKGSAKLLKRVHGQSFQWSEVGEPVAGDDPTSLFITII